jgi:Lipoxygenase
MSNFIQSILSDEASLEAYADTEKELLVFKLISLLPVDSLLKVRQQLREKVVNESYTAVGKIFHTESAIPIPGLELELWDRDLFGMKDFLGSGVTGQDGGFEIFYDPKVAGLGDNADLELRVYDPPQMAILEGKSIKRKSLVEVIKGPDNVHGAYDFGQLSIDYYEYDQEYAKFFPYCVPKSIKHDFVPDALGMTLKSVAKYGQIMDAIVQRNRRNPDEPSYAEIQKSFPETSTIALERERPSYTRSDKFFGDKMLNGFNPVLFKKDKDNPVLYTTSFNGEKFQLTGKIDLPNYKVKFELKNEQLFPIEIMLQFRDNNSIEPNPPLKNPQTYTPNDGNKWLQAKRVVRATHIGVLGEVKAHLSQCHFNMEQYSISLLRHIRKNPIRGLLYPHLKEVVHINNFGRRILMDPHGGFFAKLEPMPIIPDMLQWVRSNLGSYDWTDWQPRKPLCDSHNYAKAGNLYWGILTTYINLFFDENYDEIVRNWDEIFRFSEELVHHSVAHVSLTMEQTDDGDEWYDFNEIDDSSNPRREVNGEVKAIRPIASSNTANEQDIANLKQVCKYLIYQCTYWHSCIHNEHNPEFGELKYGALLSNGSMGDEDDESVMPGQEAASIILGASHMLTNFKYGYILKNEDGDVPAKLIELVTSKRAEFEELGFDLNSLRSRLNS